MHLKLFTAAAAASTALADRASFDCAMRQYILDASLRLQPFRTADAFMGIADALNGSPEKTQGCNVVATDLPADVTARKSRFLTSEVPKGAAGGNVFWVATDGSDSNSGTSASSPFATLQRALAATRASSGPGDTIVLRGGVYYQNTTLVLTAADSGLTIQSAPGEEAWLSGGAPLTGLTWQPYKQNASWSVVQDANAVYGSPPGTYLYGQTPDWPTCEAACKASGNCTTWTWHDKNQGGYALDCYFRYDGDHGWVPESGHVTGWAPANTWVADLSHLPLEYNVMGLRVNGTRMIRARFPNGNPETQGFGRSFQPSSWIAPSIPPQPDQEVLISGIRNDTYQQHFTSFQLGIGGSCIQFDPPAGYWCGNHSDGGGAFTYRIPSGFIANSTILTNGPYATLEGAILQTWRPGHW